MEKYKARSSLHFYFHVYFFKLRDFLFPPSRILEEAEIKPGFYVVDFGCGPGSYAVSLSRLVGKTGKIYAADIHPLAIDKVKNIISAQQLKNAEVICTDCKTGLPDKSIDVALLYDVFHALNDPNAVLRELYRILKPAGNLSFQDHRMTGKAIMDNLMKANFQLLKKGKKTYTFRKAKS